MNKSVVSALAATFSVLLVQYVIYFLSSDKCLDSGGRVVGLFGCENTQGIISNPSFSVLTIALLLLLGGTLSFIIVKVTEFLFKNEKET